MKRIILLGATSNISKFLIPELLNQSDVQLTLFARHATSRLQAYATKANVQLVDGNWNDPNDLKTVLINKDIVYLATGHFMTANKNVVHAMKEKGIERLIVAGGLGIYDEVTGEFGRWNAQMMGDYTEIKRAAKIIDDSGLNYTFLRMAWLYNDPQHTEYTIIPQGEEFKDTQVTRQAVARLIANIMQHPNLYQQASIGVAEPNTAWSKPSFY
ncbi:NAD(P)H-binding protein [Companilactobacillus keshanensis]|uniref:NAD(P)H-binding protein n=1 Tax=Companilactobacillus keshanensis TaxID=2486003 RepID=A0ABW4BTY6_9LACO|nr:NAD(P)H-binding protein [Companilactobacillus keshanensis]